MRDLFVVVFLHVETWRVFITPATHNPDESWVRTQTQTFLDRAKAEGLSVTKLTRDRDTKFTAAMNQDLKKAGIEVVRTSFRAPNMNAYVERFIQTIQQECLDHFVILGQRHFDHLVSEWLQHYHEERPHQSLGNEPLKKLKRRGRPKTHPGSISEQIVPLSEVRCEKRLGGLLKHYYRTAA